MINPRIVSQYAGALLVPLVVAGLVAAGMCAPAQVPEPVAPIAVDVAAPSTVLVCPGPVRLPTELDAGDDVVYDPQFDPAPVGSVSDVFAISTAPDEGDPADAVLWPLGSDGETTRLEVVDGTGTADLAAPSISTVLRADASGGLPAWAAGTLRVRTDGGDLRGLVAASCQYPSTQTWLVGGSTELASSARLVLANPGMTPASVTVRMWGASGPVEIVGASEYLVPAGSERVVLLEGIAAEQNRVVIQTEAAGGLVTAYIQDSRFRGLVPAGIDDVVGGQAPQQRQVVAGLSLVESAIDDIDGAVLRILAPGEEGGTADIVLLGEDGPVKVEGMTDVDLEAGTVLDVPLGGIPAGYYTAVVTADVPVVAGALLTRESAMPAELEDEAPSERAWVSSVPVGKPGPLAVPEGVDGQLVLSLVPEEGLSGSATVSVELVGEDGTTTVEKTVPGEGVVAMALTGLDVGAVTAVVVRSDDERLAWAAVLVVDDMISVLSPVPPLAQEPQVQVQVR